MRVGIPREVKTREGRVGLIPAAAAELVAHGHEVLVEKDAGRLSGYSDDDFRAVGVSIMDDADALYETAEVIVKVKEPQPEELTRLRADHILFSYLHLAAAPELLRALQDIGLTAVAFETVTGRAHLPLLAPMSDIAGRLAVQIGSNLLHHYQGGRGVLLGGLPAAERGRVVILGAGNAGSSSALVAAALGTQVTIFDRNREKLKAMRALGDNVTGLYPFADAIHQEVREADLLVGAVLITGARAPHLVDADMVRSMRPGSVIVDISVDQGGCVETTRPTSYEEPTFVWEDVLHFGVTNMPGAVPRSASQALSAAVVPYLLRLLAPNWERDQDLAAGVNVRGGKIVYPALRESA
ncbi:MAG: alanine dehydrogenase [Pseudomonadota bacterium]|nr:MAG: alanine dehydrogenase [Pseudomonadota bacterium]